MCCSQVVQDGSQEFEIVQGFPGDKDQIIANCNMNIMCERVLLLQDMVPSGKVLL